MAIIGARIEKWPLPGGQYRPMTYTGISNKIPERWQLRSLNQIVRRRGRQGGSEDDMPRWLLSLTKFCVQCWRMFDETQRDYWLHYPNPWRYWPGGGFFPLNASRWKLLKAPSRLYYPIEGATNATATIENVSDFEGQKIFVMTTNSNADIWGVVIFGSESPIVTPTYQQARVFFRFGSSESRAIIEKKPLNAVGYYRAAAFTWDGKMGVFSNQVTG